MKHSFLPADILLPRKVDLTKWSVVACDQYTSEPRYWKRVEEFVGDAPSSLKMIVPELYLEGEGVEERIEAVRAAMDGYLKDGLFDAHPSSYIYAERMLDGGKVRRGLVGMVDLEHYNYQKGSQSAIRATEGTVVERIPPRLKVRAGAPLELPHVMLLIDDPDDSVIGPVAQRAAELRPLYDFELMEKGGRIKGSLVSGRAAEGIKDALLKLGDPEAFARRYGDKGVLLLAVGDGNHSLATAKEHYEIIKKGLPEGEAKAHPARFALCEVVNVHDSALEFEPIHRVVFGVEAHELKKAFLDYIAALPPSAYAPQHVVLVTGEEDCEIEIKSPLSNLAVGTLQHFLDGYVASRGGRIDYIHGDDVVRNLSNEGQNAGFLLPPMEKSQLFETVVLDGALPRKTFSMGHAHDKRFYLECRAIR